MFKKAFGYDDTVVFYYDGHDNKYVAKGGSFAWRLNNPGLISSHSVFAKEFRAIGSFKQYAIFAHWLSGREALRAFIVSSKYCDSLLIEIAKHYQPDDPENYLKQLCAITSFSLITKPRGLSEEDFERLLNGIQKLASFSKENEGNLYLLPKISSRFYSRDRKIELYLAGHEYLLNQKEAIEWIGTHRLDAVIVRKSSGQVYLRSRPGHHLSQIRLTEDEYESGEEIHDAIREAGKERQGQCIWGYVNGVSTAPKRAQACATLISTYAEGERVWSLVNDMAYEKLGNLTDALKQQFHNSTDIVKRGSHFLRFLINLADQNVSRPPVVIFAHSQGALIVDQALDFLALEDRKRIHVFTIGVHLSYLQKRHTLIHIITSAFLILFQDLHLNNYIN